MSEKPGRNYTDILARIRTSLAGAGQIHFLGEIENHFKSYPLEAIVLGPGNPRRVLISAGIHGDEPAGVEAVCSFIEQKEYVPFLDHWEITLVPCINPFGYENGTRNNSEDKDLNRHFKSFSPPREVSLVQPVLHSPFDITLELHEDEDSSGYYLYQSGNPDLMSVLPVKIIKAVEKVVPINRDSEIDGSPANGGIIQRVSDPNKMEWWPMALYARSKGTDYCLTLETASRLALQARVKAQLIAIRTVLDHFTSR